MSGEAVKRLDRLAPTFGTCVRIRLGMDTAKYNSPLNSTGGISGGGGGLAQKPEKSVDSSGNGHRLKTIRPTIPHGGIGGGGGLGGQQFKSLGNVVKRLDRCNIFDINYHPNTAQINVQG